MVLSKEEFLPRIQALVGSDSSDESIALLEDMTDTYNDLESKTLQAETEEQENWEEKYNELDKSWRERYIARFSGETNEESEEDTANDPPPAPETYDDLFKDKESEE